MGTREYTLNESHMTEIPKVSNKEMISAGGFQFQQKRG